MNIHYLIIGIALLFAIVAIIRPAVWPLPVAVILIAIELFSRVSKSVLIFGLLALSLCAARSQTVTATNSVPMPPLGTPAEASLMQQFYDATIGTTNGVFVFTGARKLTGNANRFSADYVYSFNNNAGLLLGFDDIRSDGKSFANILKGGITLNADIYPLKNFGATNFFLKSYAFALITTPVDGTSNNGGVGQLAGAGVSYEPQFTKNLSGEIGAFYENSTGEGQFNGNWAGLLLGLHYKF